MRAPNLNSPHPVATSHASHVSQETQEAEQLAPASESQALYHKQYRQLYNGLMDKKQRPLRGPQRPYITAKARTRKTGTQSMRETIFLVSKTLFTFLQPKQVW